jgi:hypothetical protein
MDKVIPFKEKLIAILRERKISMNKFSNDTGIDRRSFFYREGHKHHKAYFMAIAYYLNMTVEDLVDGTDAMDIWYS